MQLPGYPYRGDDADGFMQRDEIVSHLLEYSASFGAPVREGVEVTALHPTDDGEFLLRAPTGDIRARQVVLASGAYQKAHRPAASSDLPSALQVIDAEGYTNPSALAPGAVLVVGSGQTGCQLAEELAESGRKVHLACGRAPWVHRRIGDRDAAAWMIETPMMEATLADLPSPLARLGANPQASGREGGHDLNYRSLQGLGVDLLGHFVGVGDGVARFAPDLAESVAFGDARYVELCELIARSCAERGLEAPDMPPPEPFVANPPEALDLSTIGVVIFTSGFRPDYESWVEFPGAFDNLGFPIQTEGSSTFVGGLHFMGVHYQRKRKSATLFGVGEDAGVLAERIATRAGVS